MRMRPRFRRLSQELEAQRRSSMCATPRRRCARSIRTATSPIRNGWRSASSSAPPAAPCTRSRPAAPGYPIVHDFEPDLEGFYRDWLNAPLGGGMKRMGDIAGRAAVITGGLTGQGLAIAHALAGQGANVAVGSFLDEQRGRADDAAAYPEAAESPESARRCKPMVARCMPAISTCATTSRSRISRRRRSGVRCRSTSWSMPPAPPPSSPSAVIPTSCGNKIIDTNLTGAFRMTRAVLPGMIERGWGRIVNIGSTAATVGWKDNPAYCASKAGLLGLTRCVALEGAAAWRHLRHDQPDLGRDRADAPQRRPGRRPRRQGAHAPPRPWPRLPRRTRSSASSSRARSPHLAVFLCRDEATRHHHGKYPGHRRFLVVIYPAVGPTWPPSTSPRRGAGSAAWQWPARCAAAPCAQSIPRRHRSSAGSALRRRQKRRPAPRRDRAGDCR